MDGDVVVRAAQRADERNADRAGGAGQQNLHGLSRSVGTEEALGAEAALVKTSRTNSGLLAGGQFSGRALKSRLTFRYHPMPAMGFFQRPFMAGSALACALSPAPTISRRWRSRALMMSSPVSPSSNRSQVPPNCWQSWFSCCASPDVDGGVRDGRRSADLAAGIDTRTGRRADASSILTGSTFLHRLPGGIRGVRVPAQLSPVGFRDVDVVVLRGGENIGECSVTLGIGDVGNLVRSRIHGRCGASIADQSCIGSSRCGRTSNGAGDGERTAVGPVEGRRPPSAPSVTGTRKGAGETGPGLRWRVVGDSRAE